jgi:hypothetical protein
MAPVRSEAFWRAAADERCGIVCDFEPDSNRMIVTFAAFPGRLTVKPFAFLGLFAEFDLKVAFVRDHDAVWYHRGVAGVGDSIDAVADHLRGLAENADEVVMLGPSAGGYAALLFGALLSCEAHAFSPQTFIDPELRRIHNDVRFQREFESLGEDMNMAYADLKPHIARSGAPAHIYYGNRCRPDVLHAERLADLDNVTLHSFEWGNHMLVRHLRDSGWINPFLVELAGGSS